MKKIVATLLILVIAGCSSLHIEKRRYTKGFSLTTNKRMKSNNDSASKESERAHNSAQTIIPLETTAVATPAVTSAPKTFNKTEAKPLLIESQSTQTNSMGLKDTYQSHQKGVKEDATVQESIQIRTTHNKNVKHEKKRQNGLWYFSFLALIPFIFKFKDVISRGSAWATNNAAKTRVLLAPIGIASAFSHYLLGNILQVGISPSMVAAPLVIGASAIALRHAKIQRIDNFIKTKISFFLFSLSGLSAAFAVGAMATPLLATSAGISDDPYLLHPALMILLMVLLIALCLGLAFLTLIGFCSLSCDGYEGAAIAVLIGGMAFTIFVLVYGILFIFRRESHKSNAKEI